MNLTAGVRLGPYEILVPLGAGGMGEVYKARDTRLDRTVALKILPALLAADPQRRERFRREARAISSLSHPHICTLHDVGEQNELQFIVMEFLPGETLAHRLLRGALSVEEVLSIAVALAAALDAAHRAGIVHRDLKPSNVMLTASGAKVLDFGLARWPANETDSHLSIEPVAAEPTLTQLGNVLGTVQYMAPEQVEGKPADARSDIFALGAIIYEMTAGRKAFEGVNATVVMTAILKSEPLAITTAQPIAPRALERVVKKCLAKDPARRWQSASDLRDELTWIEESLSEPDARAQDYSGGSATGRDRTRLSARRKRVWALAIGATVLGLPALLFAGRALVSGAFFSSGFANAAPVLESAAQLRFTVLPPDNTTGADVPIVSPDGRKLLFVARTREGKSALWVRSFDSLDSRPIADADDLAFPFWSADSRSIAFFSKDRLSRVDATGGPVQLICDAPSGRGGAWNSDGVILFAPLAESPLYRVSAGGGLPTQVTKLDKASTERSHRFPQFLADGRHFIYSTYSTGSNRPTVKVGSLDSTTSVRLTDTSFGRAWAPPGYLIFQREERGPYLAQPFDQRFLKLSGEASPIVGQVAEQMVGSDTALSVSNNGVLAYETVTGEPQIQLTWVSRTGQRLGTVGPRSHYQDFSISPDGRQVAAVRVDPHAGGADVWIMDLSRGGISRVTAEGNAEDAVWSPDGGRLAFAFARPGSGILDLYSARGNGADAAQALIVSDQNKYAWDWSRDGRYLLFGLSEGPKFNHNLWVLPLRDQDKPRIFLQSDFNKSHARFSPDGRWVAYDADESRPEVYIQSFPDPTTRFQISNAGGIQPRWRRDGKELFYISGDHKLTSVAVNTEQGFEAGPPSALFDLTATGADLDLLETSFDVDLDGQRFLTATVIEPPGRSPMTVVLNWPAALKK